MSDTDGQDTDFDSSDARIDFKTEDLIAEVELRPIIYNTQLKDYNNRALKQQMWQEVCAALVKKWDSISKTEKIAIERLVQKRWKHTRDAFTRHYRNSQDPKDRFEKKYIYHDLMLFLTPHFTERQRKSYGLDEIGEPPEKKYKTSDENQFSEKKSRHSHENRIEKDIRSLNALRRASTQQPYPKNGRPSPETMSMAANSVYHNGKHMEMPCERSASMQTPMSTCFPSHNPYEKSLLSMLHEKMNEEPDEDKHFALMLVPMLKKLDEDQKHYAKVEILKVIRNARKMPPSSDCPTLDAERYNGYANSNDYLSTLEPRMLLSSPEAEPIDCSVPIDSFPTSSKSLLKGYSKSKNKLRIKLQK